MLLLCCLLVGRTAGDFFYVMASEDNTTITITGRDSIVLNGGQTREVELTSYEYVYFNADKPILLTQVRFSLHSNYLTLFV